MDRDGVRPTGVPGAEAEPRSVAALARDDAWQVQERPRGHWILAERVVQRDGHRWVIGLTPARPAVTALIVWRDHIVVDHARGSESAMCRLAHRWAIHILNGPWP